MNSPFRSRLDDVIERIRCGNALAGGPEASVNIEDGRDRDPEPPGNSNRSALDADEHVTPFLVRDPSISTICKILEIALTNL